MTEPPRLLVCTLDAVSTPAGAASRLASTVRALAERFQVDVLTVDAAAPSSLHSPLPGARLLRVLAWGLELPPRVRLYEQAVARQVERERYAIAYFTDPYSGAVLLAHAAPAGVRCVYEVLTLSSSGLSSEACAPLLGANLHEQERRCLTGADLVLTDSREMEAFIRTLGVSAKALELTPTPSHLGNLCAALLRVGLPGGARPTQPSMGGSQRRTPPPLPWRRRAQPLPASGAAPEGGPPLTSSVDPWLAHVLQGYCPPSTPVETQGPLAGPPDEEGS